jgi:Pro-kumamolisin, activation domain/Bacterial surface protein, Ig-like domain/Immunoglobulin I-set domain/Bacterial Ig-like domain (group 3)
MKSAQSAALSHPALLACVLFLCVGVTSFGAGVVRKALSGHVPPVVAGLTPLGPVPSTTQLSLALGLPLRNQEQLQKLLQQLYDPSSTNFHRFLTSPEFTARFGPTAQDYEAVRHYVESSGLAVVGTHSNRVVMDVSGPAAKVGAAFGVSLRLYRHPTQPRVFFAPDAEPSVPADLAVANMWGLSDYALPTPLWHTADAAKASPLNYNGTGPSGSYQGSDFRNAYAPGVSLIGSGQIAAVAEFDGYYANDIATYEANCGYANVPLNNILLNVSGAPGYSGLGPNAIVEVSLDIELQIAMAPGLSQVMVYEGSNPYTVFSRIASDNTAKQISCSWSWDAGPTSKWVRHTSNSTLDAALSQMAAQGQSFFQASGDSDADTGSQAVNSSTGPIPVDSIYVTSVGGTSLSMNGAGSSWASETAWNWGNNTGSSGGVSSNYPIPSWQSSVDMSANNGSTVYRNFPDVALTADGVEVIYNNGNSTIVGGTSCAAPLWAAFTALVNQQAMASSGAPVGFLNPALYSIAAGPSYASCFHDIITGNNIGNNTPGLYYAVTNYDLATGLGTPNGAGLINALAPSSAPYFITQPVGQTATNGATVVFSAGAGGQTPLRYQWLFNGTNLPAGANVSDTTSNVLMLSAVTTANAGTYALVVTNTYGSVTSSMATLTVTFPPSFTTQPTNQTVIAGGSALFSATVAGASTLVYQWRQDGSNLANGGIVSGATSDVLTLTPVTAANAGSYTLVATNAYGSVTSGIATLTVLLPPTITIPPAAQAIQCGSNASFSVTATGTAPLRYQWSLDGSAIASATSASLSLTSVHLPSHTVAVVVTNLYGSATRFASLTVQDTLPPVITLSGANPLYVELGSDYAEPGATAYDLCVGAVPVSISGMVNTNAVSTNIVSYSASDGNGNIGTATRTVIVRDTTPPTIVWSFTNLVLAANSNCSAAMPDVTGTNYVVATDMSDPLTFTQNPATNAILPLGTNLVVITAADAYGNRAYSTNYIAVRDEMPPVITLAGSALVTAELGSPFADPGATATDACDVVALFTTNGTVNVNVVGTNMLTYVAVDASGNTNTMTRVVVVRDTAPPTVVWSFTNLVLAAGSNCTAAMPDVTGTNYIIATDLSLPLTITQAPATNTALPLGTNLVVLTLSDAYGNNAYSTNYVAVRDETPPVITLAGSALMTAELGATFADPGATVTDTCEAIALFTTNGTVNVNVAGTNTLTYLAVDGSGNTNTATRVIVVRDTTPPAIVWSFTNLVLTADSNCAAAMPDMTGTNYIVARDLSTPLTFTQDPTNNAVLPLGTNLAVITVADAYGNMAYSTNQVVVQDHVPFITSQPASQASSAGGTASFSIVAAACTPLSFQWWFNDSSLAEQTNTVLMLSKLSAANAGTYSVSVTSAGGSVTSAPAILSLAPSAALVTLTSPTNPCGFKDSLSFTAILTPATATGTIQFLTNGAVFDVESLVAGSATSVGCANLPRDTNVITALYSGDANFLSASNSIEQVVTNHLPVVLPAFYSAVAGSDLIIAVADLATNWSDVDGDQLFIAEIGTSTNGVIVSNTLPALYYYNSNHVNDQFVCAISDGFGGTNYQPVNITVVQQINAAPMISVVSGPPGSVILQLEGAAGSTYVLENTTNLPPGPWGPVATNTLGASGLWQFTDDQVTNCGQRFYRLKLLQ